MKNCYLGIDIGGTRSKFALLKSQRKHKPLVHMSETPQNLKRFEKMLSDYVSKTKKEKKLAGIGIGLPGMLDKNGKVIQCPNLPFLKGWSAEKFFKKFGIPLRVDNDSHCLMIAENEWGSAKKYKNAVVLAIGTGIGGGIKIMGKIYHGSHFSAGEFGHTIIDFEKRKTLEELGGKKAFKKFGNRSDVIGIGVANAINSLDPEAVILGGGGVNIGSVRMDTVKSLAEKYAKSSLAKKAKIIKSSLGDYASAIGAALLFSQSRL